MRTIIAALLCAVTLSGCLGMGQKPDVTLAPPPKPILAKPSAWAMAPCKDPVVLPKGPLTQKHGEDAWGTDDDSLRDCGARHAVLVHFITKRDGGLTN